MAGPSADGPVYCTHYQAPGRGLAVALRVAGICEVLEPGELAGPVLGMAHSAPLVGFELLPALRVLIETGHALGRCVVDLATELRAHDNGHTHPRDVTAEYAAQRYGLDAVRVSALEGQLRAGTGVAPLEFAAGRLGFVAGLHEVLAPTLHLPQAYFRGEYLVALAAMEAAGVPIDIERHRTFAAHQPGLRKAARGRAAYFPGGLTLEAYLAATGLAALWPRTKTGQPSTGWRTLLEMARYDARLTDLAAARRLAAGLDVRRLHPDADERLRADQRPFASVTGRNQPRSANDILGQSGWLRALIAPPPEHALLYFDWSAQEYGIAAALSQDPAMREFYAEGDPYAAMAVRLGAAVRGGVPPEVRARQKTVSLGTLYGMGPDLLAHRLRVSRAAAVELLREHRRLHPRFWEWSTRYVLEATFHGRASSVFGWPLAVTPATKATTLMNFPIQANAAEMLRYACVLAHRMGLKVLATLHDAILVEVRIDDIGAVEAQMRECMARACRAVLQGFELRVDSAEVRWPNHWKVSDEATLRHVAENCGWLQ